MLQNLAVSLKSIKTEFDNNPTDTLNSLSAQGVTGIYVDCHFEMEPSELLEKFDKSGMSVAAVLVPLDVMKVDFDSFSKYSSFTSSLKCNALVIENKSYDSAEALTELIDWLNGVNCKLRQQRIDLFYQARANDFKCFGSDDTAVTEIMDRTDIYILPDCSALKNTDIDFARFMRRNGDKAPFVMVDSECSEFVDIAIDSNCEWILLAGQAGLENTLNAVKSL